ncbi:MAG TPA: chemotaxis protein CheA [Thermoanaerobaculia bacterium]|jgi:two-component system chemotaxis sensor kinase CheA
MSEFEIDRDDIVRVFLAEAEESLALLDEMLVLLEARPNDDEVINAIFRSAHTLKGNAATLGFDALTSLAHAMEDVLDETRARRFPVNSGLITLLLRSGDAFRQMIPAAVAGSNELTPAAVSLIEALEQAKAAGFVADTSSFVVEQEGSDAGASNARRKLRVDLDRLDAILNLTSELSIAAGRLSDGMASLPERERERIAASYVDVERILTGLQEQVTQVRMVPIGPRFEQQRRTIRDLAQSAGKPVRLVIEGRDVEVDASVVDQLKDPLTHILRNAVDHGIEKADVRTARGKDPIATITLRARHDGGSVVVEVSDDGGGFDRERILARARERGMVGASGAPADEEIFGYVFAPGFSTADVVTEISGRGVGMDVVSRGIAAMRGTVQVSSVAGYGATITMRLPLTLAMLSGLVVAAAGERFVVPIGAIRQCVVVPAGESRERAYGLLDIHDRVVPYVRLGEFFGLEAEVVPHVEQMVLVEAEGMTVGLVADDLIGEMQAVIKPLGSVFRRLSGVSASTIFPDGRVGLILDVAALVRRAVRGAAA